jgi:uncharacterized membrane protein (DUF106 family)
LRPCYSTPTFQLTNAYINTSIGEAVAEDSGTAEDSDSTSTPPTPSRTVARPALPSLSRFLMIFLGLLAIYALVSPEVGEGFARVADAALFPVIGFGGGLPTVTILLAGILTTTISSLIRDHYTNWVKMARIQKVTTALRKEQMEAFRKNQATRIAKLKEVQQGYMKDSMEMQTTPLKSMAWTLLLFIVIFTWLRLFVDVTLAGLGNQWIAVPWSNHVFLNSVYVFPSWILVYSLLAIPFGQIVTRVLKYVRFQRRLGELGVPPRAGSDEIV